MENQYIVYDGRMSSPDEDTRERAWVLGFADSIKEGKEIIRDSRYDGVICSYKTRPHPTRKDVDGEIYDVKPVKHYAPRGCLTWKAHQAMAGLKP